MNYYGISQKVQEAVWPTILTLPPNQLIKKVNCYWEETFGTNGKNGKEDKVNKNPDLQTKLHQSRREQWISYRNNKK